MPVGRRVAETRQGRDVDPLCGDGEKGRVPAADEQPDRSCMVGSDDLGIAHVDLRPVGGHPLAGEQLGDGLN
ncbi:MAG: hypothetical protein M3513_13650 [Actinomycetota bacterium]|nr:hypothetical protein [Actinomycetota bacterium]